MTRNSSLRVGETSEHYAVPQTQILHHHIITPAKSTSSLMRCGSCPGSTGVSRRGSSSQSQESSPIETIGNTSVMGGSDGASVCVGSGYYTDHSTAHYDRMPIPIPVTPVTHMNSIHHISNIHSEEEIEPAYATVFPNTVANLPQPLQNIEDRSIYRRGARRWRKLYRINGHIFQPKRFNRVC